MLLAYIGTTGQGDDGGCYTRHNARIVQLLVQGHDKECMYTYSVCDIGSGNVARDI